MSSTKNLTKKQDAFCKLYTTNGKDAYAAAKEAGYATQYLHQTVSELMCNPNITEYCNKIFNRSIMKFNVNRDTTIVQIQEFLEIAKEKRDVNGAAKMIDIQCKMFGLYEPTRIEHTGKIIVSFDTDEPQVLVGGIVDKDGVQDFTPIQHNNEEFNMGNMNEEDFTSSPSNAQSQTPGNPANESGQGNDDMASDGAVIV